MHSNSTGQLFIYLFEVLNYRRKACVTDDICQAKIRSNRFQNLVIDLMSDSLVCEAKRHFAMRTAPNSFKIKKQSVIWNNAPYIHSTYFEGGLYSSNPTTPRVILIDVGKTTQPTRVICSELNVIFVRELR